MKSLRLFGVAAIEAGHVLPLAHDTSVVPFRSLGAVVSPSAYAKTSGDAGELEEYTRVVEEVYARAPILPAPPGTIFRSASVLVRWLELHYVTLSDVLNVVEGRSGARVTIALRPGFAGDGMAKQFHAAAAESFRMFRTQATATVSLPVDGDAAVIACSSFLVERDRWSSFGDTVAAEEKRHPGLIFQLTGPWPPYDFVRMQFGA